MSKNKIINTLCNYWKNAGIHPGDTLLLHSSLSRLSRHFLREKIRIRPEDIFAALKTLVGEKGTLLFPLFNFDFTSGTPFDSRHSPSHMGALTEYVRQHEDGVRTGHPVYSFFVTGHLQDRFKNLDNESAYGADSPFALLRELDGKIAVLDLPDQNSMTFYHHVEEMLDVPYRYHKFFEGPYTDATGHTQNKRYSIFVRDIENGVLTHVDPMGELLWAEGLYVGCPAKTGHGLRSIRAQVLYERVAKVIENQAAEGLLFKREVLT